MNPRAANRIDPGDEVQVGSRVATYIRVVTPKRSPWLAPTYALVQFKGNLGPSKVKITAIKYLTR